MAIQYLDSKRIRGSSTGGRVVRKYAYATDYSTTVSATNLASDNSDWVSSDSSNSEISSDRLNFTSDASEDVMYYDLQNANALNGNNADDEKWVLRFTYNVTSKAHNNYHYIGLSSTTTDGGEDQDQISWFLRHPAASNDKSYGCHDIEDAAPASVAEGNKNGFDGGVGATYYFELARTSATAYAIRKYTDSDYDTLDQSEITGSCAATLNNLRYIKLTAHSSSNATYVFKFDNVKFWNGVTNAAEAEPDDSIVNAGTDEKATLVTAAAPADDGWTLTSGASSYISIDDTVAGAFKITAPPNNVDYRAYYDLGETISDTTWTARWKFKASSGATGGNEQYMCSLASTTGNPYTASHDLIAATWSAGDGDPYMRTTYQNSSGSHTQGGSKNTSWSLNTTYYVEMARTADDTVTLKVFTGSDYSTGQVGSDISYPIATGTQNLRYLSIGNISWGNSGTSHSSEIDDMNIWFTNATATGTADKTFTFSEAAAYSNLPENTLFEETDTYRTYWLQDNVWKPEWWNIGLKSLWNMNVASGNVPNTATGSADTLGSAADLTITNSPVYEASTGIANLPKGMDFNSDYGTAGSSVSQYNFLHEPNTKWTIAIWFKLNGGSDTDGIIDNIRNSSSNRGIMVRLRTTAKWKFQLSSGSAIRIEDENDTISSSYKLYVMTYDDTLSSDNYKKRVNNAGLYTRTKTGVLTSGDSSYALVLGAWQNSSAFINGSFAQVAIWNRVLTDAEQTLLYNDGDGLAME